MIMWMPFGRQSLLSQENAARGTCYGTGGPNTATTDSPGGPLMVGDHPQHAHSKNLVIKNGNGRLSNKL